MDRSIVYASEQGRSTDFLFAQRAALVALAKLSKAAFGSNTLVEGLAVSPTNPASLSVSVAPGQIYSLQNLDGSAYGVLAADTTHQVVKQGLLLDAITLSCPAPATAGNSINYLIQAAYQDSDTNNAVLPYFNSANPSQPLSGQNNSGVAQPTERQGLISIGAKAGASAATGSQTTPAPDTGYVGLYVVTVANGATTITASNIVQVAGAPILSNLLSLIQTDGAIYAVDTGAANAYVATPTPGIASLSDGMRARFKATNANTGASTLNWSGTGAKTLQGMSGALQGGEILAGQTYDAVWSAGLAAWVLVGQTGGALQVVNASKSQQAVALEQALRQFGGHVTTLTGVSGGTSVSLTLANAGLVVIDCTNGAVTATLPAANALAGVPFEFIRIDSASANAATVQGAGTDTIDGAASVALTGQLSGLSIRGDGASTWRNRGRGNAALPMWTGNATDPKQAIALGQLLGTGLVNVAGGTAGSNVLKFPFWDGTQLRTLLIQSVTTVVASAAYSSATFYNTAITWPTAFPNALLGAWGTHEGGQTAGAYSNYTFEGASLTGGTHIISYGAAVTLGEVFSALAIGY